MKNKIKSIILVILGLVITSTLFALPAQARAAVDMDSSAHGDWPLLRVLNYTVNPGGTNWRKAVNADAGQLISLNLYYRNFTQEELARGVRLSVDAPSGTSRNFTISANLRAENSIRTYTDTVSVNLSSEQSLTFVSGSVKWYPGVDLVVTPLPNGQSGNGIVLNGINIGSVRYGASNAGQVTLRFLVSNNTPPQGNAPSVTTNSASFITENSARLNSSVNPNGAFTSAWFEYGSSASLGNQTPSLSIGSGNTSQDFSQIISGLSSNSAYYFRAVAQNQHGVSRGSIVSFNTSGQQGRQPSAYTVSAINIGDYHATLRGSVNPHGFSADYWFEYGTSQSNLNQSTSQQNIGSGDYSQDVSRYISGLNSNITYYYRVVARNNYGTDRGEILSFNTTGGNNNSAPAASTSYPTGIDNYSATFRGNVNPNGSYTYAYFEYGTSCNNLSSRTSEEGVGSGSYDQGFSRYVSGLNSSASYCYRLVARNDYGTSYGNTVTFSTSGGGGGCLAPSVTSASASFTTENSASLRGTVSPNGYSTEAWFEYGASYSLGLRTPHQTFYGGYGSQDLIRYVSGLQPNTTYYFRAVAQSSCGTNYGSILSFSTSGSSNQPLVVTRPATNIDQNSALFNGEVSPRNSNDTIAWFEYSADSSFGVYLTTPSSGAGYGDYSMSISHLVLGLSPYTNYYFRAVARNNAGTNRGAILNFRTAGSPVPPSPNPSSGDLSAWKEVKNLTFPNGTQYVNASSIGDVIEYAINVKNVGGSTANNVTVKDTISSYYDIVEARPNYSTSELNGTGTRLTWNLGSISPSENRVIYIKVKSRTVEQSVVIYNSFTASTGSITRSSNKTTTILNPSMMAMDLAADKGTVDRNGMFNYNIRYRNIGINDVDNVIVKLSLPEGIKFVTSNPSTSSSDANVHFYRLGRVAKGQVGSISIQAQVLEGAEIGSRQIATAVLDYDDIFGTPQRNISSSAIVDVGTGFAALAAAAGFSFGGNWWTYFLWAIIIILVMAIAYLYFKISRILNNHY